MALFKISRGSESTLPSKLTDGYAYFCTDTGSFWIDYTDTDGNLQRKQLNAQDAKTLMGKSLDELKTYVAVQPNWNQNDTTALDYIKNRPFYDTDRALIYSKTVTVTESGGVYEATDQSSDVPSSALIKDNVYTVVFDGTTYDCTCSNGVLLGNSSLYGMGDNTQEPFLIGISAGNTVIITTNDTSETTHSIEIYGQFIQTIDKKYLPALPYITHSEASDYYAPLDEFNELNSNLTYKGRTYSSSYRHFAFFLTNDGIWDIGLITSGNQIPSSSEFRMNYATDDGTISFYWSKEDRTDDINTKFHAYLYDVNTGTILRRENSVQTLTIGPYIKKSHNFPFYHNKTSPCWEQIVKSFDDIARVPKVATVALPTANWTGDASPYSQVVTISGTTPNSKVDMQPDPNILQLLTDWETSLVAGNDGGVITIYAVGEKPDQDFTVQVTVTEVNA